MVAILNFADFCVLSTTRHASIYLVFLSTVKVYRYRWELIRKRRLRPSTHFSWITKITLFCLMVAILNFTDFVSIIPLDLPKSRWCFSVLWKYTDANESSLERGDFNFVGIHQSVGTWFPLFLQTEISQNPTNSCFTVWCNKYKRIPDFPRSINILPVFLCSTMYNLWQDPGTLDEIQQCIITVLVKQSIW